MPAPSEPGRGGTDESTSESVRSVGHPTPPDARPTWIRRLFPTSEFWPVVRRSLALSLALFVVGYVLALVWGLDRYYLDPNTFLGVSAYFGTVGVFLELLILGQWSVTYGRIWEAVETCFVREDREQYRTTVADHLDRMHHVRRDRVVDLKLVILAFLLVEPPFLVWVNGLDLLHPWDFLLAYYNVVLVGLGLTGIYLFALHVHLVSRVARLGLDNPYTAARELEPLARLSVSVSVYWFVGVTVLGVYYWLDFVEFLFATGSISLTAVTLPYNLAVHLGLMAFLVAVGALIFLLPPWLVHLAIVDARRSIVDSLDERRNEVVRGWDGRPDGDWVELQEQLDGLESIHRSADRISTWPYVVGDVVKVALSAVLPVGQIFLGVIL